MVWEGKAGGGGGTLPHRGQILNLVTDLSHLDELDEDFCPELRGGAAENHQLYPLGDAVTQGNGPLHGGILLHTAIHEVILIVGELGKKKPIRTGPLVIWEIREAQHFCSEDSSVDAMGLRTLWPPSCKSSTWLMRMVGRKSFLCYPKHGFSTSKVIRPKWMYPHTS